jgi:iron complex transport system substrate-binding protein
MDDAQRTVGIDHPARRIIAIAPNLAELVYAAGAGQWLIATVRGADYPRQVAALPSVGDASGLDFERIRQLEPDLVLAWGSGNKPADIARLQHSPVATVVLEPHQLDDVARHLRLVGELAGTQTLAETAAARFEQGLQQLRQRYANARVIDVVVQIWDQPVFTVGAAHPLTDALRVCGARNALADYPLLAGPVPIENVLAADADVILSVTGMPRSGTIARWQRWLSLGGKKSVKWISMDPDLLTRSGPRILEGVAMLCARLDQLRDTAVESGAAQ